VMEVPSGPIFTFTLHVYTSNPILSLIPILDHLLVITR
jgi:hypothetical protein